MRSQRTDLRGVLPYIFFPAIAILLILSAYQKQHWDTDIFWAIKSGEWILSHLRAPETDPFSYTFGGKPWVDFTWGFQVLSYLFFTYIGGWTGLFILQLIITSLTFLFVYLNLRLLASKDASLSLSLLVLVYVSSNTRLFIRPHLFEYLFVSLYLLIFNLHEREGKAWPLYLLIPLQALWVNIHSSAILGVFIAGAYAAGEVIDEWRGNGFGFKLDLSGRAKKLLAASVFVPAAALLNPYGLKLAIFPFIHQNESGDALRHIGEWTKPHLKELFFYLFPFPVDHLAFVILVFGAAVTIILNYRKFRSREIMLLGASLYMAVSHVRWVPLFAFFAAPVMASNLFSLLKERGGEGRTVPLLSAGVAFFMAAVMFIDFSTALKDNIGLGLKSGMYPEGTVSFMKKEGLRGNIYNEYVFGGYIIHAYPEVKVFIDGRTPTVFSPYFFWQSRLTNDPERWKRLSDEYGIDMALIKIKDPFCNKLRENGDWAPVSFDDVSILYLKKTERFKDVISKWGLIEVNACSEGNKFKLPEDKMKLTAMREELKKVISSLPDASSARARRLLGLVDTRLGDLEGALHQFRKAISLNPDDYTYYDYGLALAKLNRYDESIRAFKKTTDINSEFKDAYMAMGLAYFDMSDYKNAICSLSKYTELADDGSEAAAYKTLGLSYFRTGSFEKAAEYLQRAAFLTDDAKERADVYYELGNAYLEHGDAEGACRAYGKAVSLKPEYREVLKALAGNLSKAGKTENAKAVIEAVNRSAPAKNLPENPLK